ncbi:hypothetical protein AOLI_G00254380 [Acnodon oligacanthus]
MAGSSGPRVRLMLTSAHKLLPPPPLRSSRTNAERGRLSPRMAGRKLTSDSPLLQNDTASSWHTPPASKPSWKRIGMLAAVRKNFPRHVNVAMDVCQTAFSSPVSADWSCHDFIFPWDGHLSAELSFSEGKQYSLA